MTATKKKAAAKRPAKPAARSRRKYPNVRVRNNVACQSARTSAIRAIVIHSTEGPNQPGLPDLQGLGQFFDRLSTEASSHVANDAEGNSARYVPDSRKAWTCAGFNSQTLNIEQIGYAAQAEWPEAQLRETARWIAYWSRKHGIPIQKGAVSNGVVIRPGVLRHSELGVAGGGHSDPGANYPLKQVLRFAREYRDRQNKKGG